MSAPHVTAEEEKMNDKKPHTTTRQRTGALLALAEDELRAQGYDPDETVLDPTKPLTLREALVYTMTVQGARDAVDLVAHRYAERARQELWDLIARGEL